MPACARRRPPHCLLLVAVVLFTFATPASAYIGPGAGFAVLSSLLTVFITIAVAILSVLLWPLRALVRSIREPAPPRSSINRLIIVGLDGQDPTLTDRFIEEGILPNFARLARDGSYRRLKTTLPSVSPVAWSSFSTGTNPGRHNIFDFLDRDYQTYLPRLSSARIGAVKRVIRIGKYRIPLERPELRLLRKSRPFWSILGERRIWSTILRVPVTFPPRPLLRSGAERDVGSGSARHPGHVSALYDPSGPGRLHGGWDSGARPGDG